MQNSYRYGLVLVIDVVYGVNVVATGEVVSVDERIAEIVQRYGPGGLVTRFIKRAEPRLVSSVARTRRQLWLIGNRDNRFWAFREMQPVACVFEALAADLPSECHPIDESPRHTPEAETVTGEMAYEWDSC